MRKENFALLKDDQAVIKLPLIRISSVLLHYRIYHVINNNNSATPKNISRELCINQFRISSVSVMQL